MDHGSPSEKELKTAIASCLAYSFCSISMVLLNKTLVVEGTSIPLSCVMLTQNLSVLALVFALDTYLPTHTKTAWSMKRPHITIETCMKWLPVNIIFLTMLYSGFKTLQLVTVSLVSICKNATNLFTTIGDYILFGEPINMKIGIALFLMIFAAVLGSAEEFNFSGDFKILAATWMLLNCASTSAYVLQIKMSQNRTCLSPYGCTFYNALIATPLTLIWGLLSGELVSFIRLVPIQGLIFHLSLALSSLVGFGIGFSIFWCISATSPTTCAMVGAGNKIPLAILGIILFNEPTTAQRLSFIFLGLLSGLIYTYAKAERSKEKSAKGSEITVSSSELDVMNITSDPDATRSS
ncbi:hypothetical protein AAMO2058_001495200 [Amorphochlora amoebiformis]